MHHLKPLTIALGAVITAIGFLGVVAPSLLLEFGRSLQTVGSLYAVAAVRVALGLLLFCVASVSRMPKVLRVLGGAIVLAGLFTPFFGVERTQAMLTWWSGQGQVFMRASASVAVVVGLFIIYAVTSSRRAAA